MLEDALRSTEIQSGVLIIKGWATQRKAKEGGGGGVQEGVCHQELLIYCSR